MAVFLLNICKFNGCGLTFPTLADLIQHIEEIHIDDDPAVVEQREQQQHQCVPLSYVLRFFSDAARKEWAESKKNADASKPVYMSPPRSLTPTGSEIDEPSTESEDSNDSWTTSEQFSSEFILRQGSKQNTSPVKSLDKPFACPVPGCKKRYKNINGIKYHSKNGHKKDGKIKKGYKCHCGKSYKTNQGLKHHTGTQHRPLFSDLTSQPNVRTVVKQIPVSALTNLLPKGVQGLVVSSKSCIKDFVDGTKIDIAALKSLIENGKNEKTFTVTKAHLPVPKLVVTKPNADIHNGPGVFTPTPSSHTFQEKNAFVMNAVQNDSTNIPILE